MQIRNDIRLIQWVSQTNSKCMTTLLLYRQLNAELWSILKVYRTRLNRLSRLQRSSWYHYRRRWYRLSLRFTSYLVHDAERRFPHESIVANLSTSDTIDTSIVLPNDIIT